jgi:hypothetical protein
VRSSYPRAAAIPGVSFRGLYKIRETRFDEANLLNFLYIRKKTFICFMLSIGIAEKAKTDAMDAMDKALGKN